MAETLLLAWCAGILGYGVGLAVHLQLSIHYRRYLPRAVDRGVVQGWIWDKTNRAVIKAVLIIWGLARLALIAERPDGELTSTTVLHLDLLTLSLYWGLLLLLTHWTWRVRRRRAYDNAEPDTAHPKE